MKASEWGASLETGLTDNFSSYSITQSNITHSTGGGVKSLHILVVNFREKGTEKKKTDKIEAMECKDCIYII
jgi:hypothetical protein